MQRIINILFMAFVMVTVSTLVLIPFMLYVLDLQSTGWTAGYVALFGAMIASTDAAAVSAGLNAGGCPVHSIARMNVCTMHLLVAPYAALWYMLVPYVAPWVACICSTAWMA